MPADLRNPSVIHATAQRRAAKFVVELRAGETLLLEFPLDVKSDRAADAVAHAMCKAATAAREHFGRV